MRVPSQSARSSWSRARTALGIAAYAASRIRRCRKRYASSPGMSASTGRDELVAHEARQMPFDVAAHVVRNEGGNRAAMEHLALHGPSLQHRPHVPIERVDAGLQQRLDRRRHGHVAAPAFADHGEHLLDEQGVTGGGDRDPLAQCQVDRRPGAETFHQLAALLRRERLEKERRGVQLASAPVGTQVEELGAGNAKDEEGSAPGEVYDVLDEDARKTGSARCRSSTTTTCARSDARDSAACGT